MTGMRLKSLLAAAGVLAATAAFADDSGNQPITLAVFGDWPYSQTLLDNADLLINSVNADKQVSAVVHVGDIHSGSMACTGAGLSQQQVAQLPKVSPGWNQAIYYQFQQFNPPVVYTPGDNEWTDCHKAKEGTSGAPLKELASVRQLFFARPGHTLGRTDAQVWSQAQYFDPNFPTDSQYVENVMWRSGKTVFATFNMPGGSNNDDPVTNPWTAPFTDNAAQAQEQQQRTEADIRWLQATFAAAQDSKAKAVVLALQADMWDPEASLDKYQSFIAKMGELATKFGRPVLLINGDSHIYKTDKPLQNVPNLKRIVVQGSTNDPAEWLRLTIDTRKSQPFSWVNVPYCAYPSTNGCS